MSFIEFRFPDLNTIIRVTKIKKSFLKKKERVKGFFNFMTMLSFKQAESNYRLTNLTRALRTIAGLLKFLIV